jgi:tetratricopeptide (TPR) repeat protein
VQAPTPNDDAEKLLSAGIEALKAGDSARARELLGQAIRRNPRDERAWLWLSGAMGTDEERRQCLERVLQINPNNAAARSGLATLAAAASAPARSAAPSAPPPSTRPVEATPAAPQLPSPASDSSTPAAASIASLRAVSTPRRLNPQLVAVVVAACVVVALGAILLMRRFGGPAPSQPTTAPAVALAATEPPTATRQPTPTRARPTQAATATPTSTPSPTAAPTSTPTAAGKLILEGLAKAQAKDYQGAIVLYNQALKREPQNAEAFFQRGQARDGLGDPRSAIKNYTQVLQIDPNHSAAYSARGDARLKLKDIPGALEDYQRAAELYTSAGDTERAKAIADKIKALQ